MKMHNTSNKAWEPFKADCAKCSGLCCTALFFSKADGFPKNKAAGTPCVNLLKDYGCRIHSELEQLQMRGCIGYDCLGAGQQVTQIIYGGQTWSTLPEQAGEIFDVFCAVFQLYQIRYFLTEATLLISAQSLHEEIQNLLEESSDICQCTPKEILAFDIEAYQDEANRILKQACHMLQQALHSDKKPCPKDFLGKSFRGKDMSGLDFSTRLLIGADFSNCTLDGTIFLGADTRDTDFSNSDLREAVFLTQGQINSARGNRNTKIPEHLYYPVTWK